jgi:hypothetical protein
MPRPRRSSCPKTFAEAISSRRRYRDEGVDGVGWLYGISKHLLSRYFRAGAVEARARRRLGMPERTVSDDDYDRIEEHRPQRPILLAVDQKLGEGAALRVAPELADPIGPFEVGEHEDVEQLGAGSRLSASRRSHSCLSSSFGRMRSGDYGVAGQRETAGPPSIASFDEGGRLRGFRSPDRSGESGCSFRPQDGGVMRGASTSLRLPRLQQPPNNAWT